MKTFWLWKTGETCQVAQNITRIFDSRIIDYFIKVGHVKSLYKPNIGNLKVEALRVDGPTVALILHGFF
jgi:hypothetical protein